MSRHRLDPFFHPHSIAIVGASERGLYPAGVLRNLIDFGYAGNVYPINPRRESVFGLSCYPDIASLPEAPELAIIIVPRHAVADVMRQCVGIGVPAALIITAGFAESDDVGGALQAEITDLIAGEQITVIGPNCAGLANIANNLVATRLPVPPRAGNIGFISASGALMMALYGVFSDYHLGLSKLISLGNQMDVTLAESLAYLASDPETAVIGAFVEGLQDGRAFVSAAHAAFDAGKPLVIVKSGRTDVGQQAAATHTAALAGSDRVFQAVCRQFGVVQCDDVMDLTRTVQMFSAWAGRWPTGKRVALVTQSGGMGSLTADLCTFAGLELPPLSAQVQHTLQGMDKLLAFGDFGNPADVRGAGAAGSQTAATLAPFLADPETDVVILLLAKSAVREEDVATTEAIIAATRKTDKPLGVVWTGQREPTSNVAWPRAFRLLIEAGIPTFEQPSDCVHTLRRVIEFGTRSSERGTLVPSAINAPLRLPRSAPPAPRLLGYGESVALLARYGIATMPAEVAQTADQAVAAAQKVGYPVALKALSSAFSHKSDAGLVRLGLNDGDAVRQVATELLDTLSGHESEGVLVQRMAAAGVEVIVGLHQDAQFGPVVACGPGGILVELLDEVALRLPPLDRAQARALVAETRLARLLSGLRGQPARDVDALIDLLVKLSYLAVDEQTRLNSLDLNPIIILPGGDGTAVVDVRVSWRE